MPTPLFSAEWKQTSFWRHNRSFYAHCWSSCFCFNKQSPTVLEKEDLSWYWEVQNTSFQPVYFLIMSVFRPIKNIKNPLFYFLFFIGLLRFCCPGASNETASENLVWKETPYAYTFSKSKLVLIPHLRFLIKTRWTQIEGVNNFVP